MTEGTTTEPPAGWSEMVGSLTRFGLSEREADLYLALVQRGRASAREITRDRGLDRVLGYRILDGLRVRGVLQVTTERPRRYVPIPPRLLFDRALEERRLRLQEDDALARGIADRLPTWLRSADELPRYQVLSGATLLYPTLSEMVARATERVDTMITRRALRDSLKFGLHRKIGEFLRRGGRFRLLVEADESIGPLLQRLSRTTRRFPKAEVRRVHPQPTRMTLVDGHELLLYLVPETRAQVEEVAVWTNAAAFVGGHAIYFDEVWGRAEAPGPPPRAARNAARASTSAP